MRKARKGWVFTFNSLGLFHLKVWGGGGTEGFLKGGRGRILN